MKLSFHAAFARPRTKHASLKENGVFVLQVTMNKIVFHIVYVQYIKHDTDLRAEAARNFQADVRSPGGEERVESTHRKSANYSISIFLNIQWTAYILIYHVFIYL